jgi:hypothetical protein
MTSSGYFSGFWKIIPEMDGFTSNRFFDLPDKFKYTCNELVILSVLIHKNVENDTAAFYGNAANG